MAEVKGKSAGTRVCRRITQGAAAIERADNETMAQFDALFDPAYDAVAGQRVNR